MSNLAITPYVDFDNKQSFGYSVDNISGFAIRVEFPAIAVWNDDHLRARWQDRLHDDFAKLLRTAEFYSLNSLSQTKGVDYFGVSYSDDIFDFSITCYQDCIMVRKSGVQLSTFYDWYFRAVPSLQTLIGSILSVMGGDVKREQSITSVGFTFNFVAHDFKHMGIQRKNYEIISRLITKVPGVDGVIMPVGERPQEFSRTNFLVNCWDQSENQPRRLFSYAVQAPSNKHYSGLYFEFGYGSGTYSDPSTGLREWTDPAKILTEFDRAFSFLWKNAVCGFMRTLLADLTFKTTANYIP